MMPAEGGRDTLDCTARFRRWRNPSPVTCPIIGFRLDMRLLHRGVDPLFAIILPVKNDIDM